MPSTLAVITPLEGNPPGVVAPPIYNRPEIWPPKGLPPLPPIEGLPPGWWDKPPATGLWPIEPPDWPIVVPVPPDKPVPGDPPTLWPPLPPSAGVAGRALILIWIVGVGYRWLVYESRPIHTPPEPEPK